jgi:hypothetical protein
MKQSEFLITSINCCKANLAKPNVRYPNGRMSHDVEAEHLDDLTNQLEDYKLDYGTWDAWGKFAGFDDATYDKENG